MASKRNHAAKDCQSDNAANRTDPGYAYHYAKGVKTSRRAVS
ncbi:hypothetical protein CAMRE0001_1138 [Campylobacter rectus RM3267]|uniref:Uncharacterized protein n=1 Tax=Campylobacter rectus RM3267 TaxID=553218 RepID=B9D0D7_CAMRE|nr:hypothetical protein CAMRE0001_1138 [Campylobacter rectus RM3267]